MNNNKEKHTEGSVRKSTTKTVPRPWILKGLEFEFQVAKIFQEHDYHVYGEHTFEMMREIGELRPFKNEEFVTRSCDFVATKFYNECEIKKDDFKMSLKFFIECKHGGFQDIFFIPPLALETENSRNISVILPNPLGIDLDFASYFRRYQWDSISLGKGLSVGENKQKEIVENQLLETGIRQSCLACLDFFARMLAHYNPKLRVYSDLRPFEMFIMLPIIITKNNIWYRDYSKNIDPPSENDLVDNFFKKIDFGLIHFFPKNFMVRFLRKSINQYLELPESGLEGITLSYGQREVEEYLIPSRCFITTFDSLPDLLKIIENSIIKESRKDIQTFLSKMKKETSCKINDNLLFTSFSNE